MTRIHTSLLLFLLVSLIGAARADEVKKRELLYHGPSSEKLKEIVGMLRDPENNKKIPYPEFTRTTDYFVRIAPRKPILTENNEVQPGAILGTKPLVFVTTPECIRGRTLLEIYEDIGYEAEDIIRWQRDQDMVAIVFRFPKEISYSNVTDGRFPEDWDKKVYVPTWENVNSLFSQLANCGTIEPEKKGEFAPERTFFRSQAEKGFVLGFPEDGKRRLKTIPYATLRTIGGADWVYRKLLEDKLSVFEHFEGNGWTHNELLDPDNLNPEAGLLEFVGPNMKIKNLPEVAIIHLGRLSVEDTYSARGIPSSVGR